MQITTSSFTHGQRIPDAYVFCRPDADTHCTFSDNRNPALAWSDVPAEAKSLVLICVDPDVPSVGDDVNQEGRTVPADLPRCDFYHWVMVDIPTACQGIDEAAASEGVTAKGKTQPGGPAGARHGINDYTNWFAGDDDMGGDYLGYDGPCPPWNDELLHHYHFKLFALDVERCDVGERFTGGDVMEAIAGHVIAECEVVGTYTLNASMID